MTHYFGNYPGSGTGFDNNVPYGWNQWDALGYPNRRPRYSEVIPDEEEIQPNPQETLNIGEGAEDNDMSDDYPFHPHENL